MDAKKNTQHFHQVLRLFTNILGIVQHNIKVIFFFIKANVFTQIVTNIMQMKCLKLPSQLPIYFSLLLCELYLSGYEL